MNEQQFKALPPDQRKAHQERLQALGLYAGKIDGNWGDGTKTAFEQETRQKSDSEASAGARAAQERADALKAKEFELKGKELEQSGKTKDVESEAARAKIARQLAYDQDANSGWGIATQTLANAPAALAGVAAGRGMGAGVNALMDRSQANKNATLAAAAQDRVAGLTTREGSRVGTQLAGAMPSSSSTARVLGRMAPHAGLAAFMIGKGGYMLDQDEEQPFYPEMANRAAGLGMIGAGTGIAERGITYGVSPGVPPDAKSIAIIESNQLRRNNAAQPGAPKGPNPGTKAALLADAKAAGIKGVSKMNKGQIAAALANVTRKIPALAGPGVAASLAYGMSPDEAQAADGSGGGDSQALTNAALAGGGYAGARAAAPSVAQSLAGTTLAKYAAPVASGIGRVAARAAGPVGLGLAAYDTVRGINDLAHLSPPQDPSQYSTMGGFMPPGVDQGQPAPAPQGAPPQGPMMNAAALPMPQNVPPDATQQANIASEFDPAMRGPQQADLGLPPELQSQIQMLSQQGVPPELIATYLNHMAAQQGAM